jgi:hypothetical protein
MASLEQIGIRREGVINRLEALVKDTALELGLDASEFTLTVQERDTTILYLKQLEAITEQLDLINQAVKGSSTTFLDEINGLKAALETKVQEAAKVPETQPIQVEVTPAESHDIKVSDKPGAVRPVDEVQVKTSGNKVKGK